jgi:hypothetical protein
MSSAEEKSPHQQLMDELFKGIKKFYAEKNKRAFGQPVPEFKNKHVYFSDLLTMKHSIKLVDMQKIVNTLSSRVAVVTNGGECFTVVLEKRYEVDEVKQESFEYNGIDIVPFTKLKGNFKTFFINVKYMKKNIPISIPQLIDLFKQYYLYNAMEDRPDTLNENVLNIWQDFAANNLGDESIKPNKMILNHIKDVLANGEEDRYKYIINYLAWLMQEAGKKIGVAMIFTSKQGAGKNILFDWIIKYIYGVRGCTVTHLDKLTGKFNSLLLGKSLIVGNEICSDSASYKVDANVLKGLITETEANIEKKGHDAITCKTYCNFIFLSNSKNPVKIEESDRRYAVFDCSNDRVNDHDYFAKLGQILNKDEADKFYTYLMYKNIRNFNPRKFPITEARQEMQAMSNPIKTFVYEEMDWKFGDDGKPELMHLSNDVYPAYDEWCKKSNYKPKSCGNFSAEIRDIVPSKQKRVKGAWFLSAPIDYVRPVNPGEGNKIEPNNEADESSAEAGKTVKKHKKSNKEKTKYEVKKSNMDS